MYFIASASSSPPYTNRGEGRNARFCGDVYVGRSKCRHVTSQTRGKEGVTKPPMTEYTKQASRLVVKWYNKNSETF